MANLPSSARVVIVGGGIVGCSVAYHLAKRGVTDVVLLERKQLTSGTTWHAAGLVGQLRATNNLTRLAQYTTNLFATLEQETGQATGFQQRGSVSIAPNEERFEELKRGASTARVFGLEVNIITPQDVKDLVPLARVDDLVGGVHLPNDGVVNPIDVTQALAKGARSAGVKIFENVKVERILTSNGRATGVQTEFGTITADAVVNAAGMWARELGDQVGATVPLHAAEHFYIVTEGVEGISPSMPVLRDPEGCGYFKEDAGKLLVGWFEPVAKPWGMKGISEEFSFTSLPEDFEHIAPLVENATHRMPILAETGIRLFFNGPESFTPDDRYLLGEQPEVKGLYVAAGFNSIGIQSSGGAGKVLADWIVDGRPPMDLWDVDVRRVMPFQRNRSYLHDRTVESLGLLYAMHWPFRQPETARGVRRSPFHDRLAAKGACFGEVAGWERTNWFAPEGKKAEYEYTYGRQNWFEYSAAEHRATREGVTMFDQSSFGKFMLEGPDAERIINQVSANDMSVANGKIVYTQWLNERGGIEADLTVLRVASDGRQDPFVLASLERPAGVAASVEFETATTLDFRPGQPAFRTVVRAAPGGVEVDFGAQQGLRNQSPVQATVTPGGIDLGSLFVELGREQLELCGQVALPGGRRDPQESDLVETAVRETREELALDLHAHGELIGPIDELRPRTPVLPPEIGRAHV